MYQVYVLKSSIEDWVYVGMTKNLKKRLDEHNSGNVLSTKSRRPFAVVYQEECCNSKEARMRERYFKNTSGKEWLRRRNII